MHKPVIAVERYRADIRLPLVYRGDGGRRGVRFRVRLRKLGCMLSSADILLGSRRERGAFAFARGRLSDLGASLRTYVHSLLEAPAGDWG
jgi:hypothetical protein